MSTTRRPAPIPGTPRHGNAAKEDARSWYEGHRAGRRGESLHTCPYAFGTIESWSWVGGHIQGKERREHDARRA